MVKQIAQVTLESPQIHSLSVALGPQTHSLSVALSPQIHSLSVHRLMRPVTLGPQIDSTHMLQEFKNEYKHEIDGASASKYSRSFDRHVSKKLIKE